MLGVVTGTGGVVGAVLGTGGQSESVGAGDVLEEALKALEAMNAKNWRKQRDVVAGLIRKTQQGLGRYPLVTYTHDRNIY